MTDALSLPQPAGPLVTPAAALTSPAAVYLSSLSPGSAQTMRRCLDRLARRLGAADADALPWWELGAEHVAALRQQLAAEYSPQTANLHLAALRGVVRACWTLRLLSTDQRERLLAVQAVRGSRLPPGRALTQPELARLFGALDPGSARGARDAALLGVLAGGGLRISEPGKLSLEAWHWSPGPHGGAAPVGFLRVLGKGQKERRVPLPPGAQRAVRAWLEVRGGAPGYLFCHVRRGGVPLPARGLGADGAAAAVLELAERAGVKLTSHDLRRTLITGLLASGADAILVAAIAGHASPVTTAKYDRRGEEAADRAVAKIDIPYGDP